MSAHVVLKLLNELRNSDKMRDLPSILTLLRNKFNIFFKYRITIVRFCLSHDIKISLTSHFGRENGRVCRLLRNFKIYVIT